MSGVDIGLAGEDVAAGQKKGVGTGDSIMI